MRDDGGAISLAFIKKGMYCNGTMQKSPILELWKCADARKRASLASEILRREHAQETAKATTSCPTPEDVRAVQNLLGR